MMMMFFTALAVLVLFDFTAPSLQAAEDKVGFIDAQRVLSSHPKYDESQKYMEEFVRKKTEEAKTVAEKETDQGKRMAIIDNARWESGDEEKRIMNPITKDINKVIESVAKAKGVTVVLNNMLIYFGGVDLTEDVIKGLKELKL
jgi:outer membrane protein